MLYHGQKGSPHPRISPRHPQHGARAGLEQRLPRTSFTELPSRGTKNTRFLPRSCVSPSGGQPCNSHPNNVAQSSDPLPGLANTCLQGAIARALLIPSSTGCLANIEL